MEEIFMKATGIVRRIDDLGRIVIPKEIRRVLHIKESDPIEIFAGREGEIVLKKYSPIGELEIFANDLVESLYSVTGQVSCITDRDSFVAVAGNRKKELEGRTMSKVLEELIEKRTVYTLTDGQEIIQLTKKEDCIMEQGVVAPILCHGDCVGSVIILGKGDDTFDAEFIKNMAKVSTTFLSRQLEL